MLPAANPDDEAGALLHQDIQGGTEGEDRPSHAHQVEFTVLAIHLSPARHVTALSPCSPSLGSNALLATRTRLTALHVYAHAHTHARCVSMPLTPASSHLAAGQRTPARQCSSCKGDAKASSQHSHRLAHPFAFPLLPSSFSNLLRCFSSYAPLLLCPGFSRCSSS